MTKEFLELIEKESQFYNSPLHGITHWKTVERNGHYIANTNDADKSVISYFAYIHDCMRENEDEDPKHGTRGAYFAMKHRDLIDLDNQQFELLISACKSHTHGKRINNSTIGSCWDADRLDLIRARITPLSQFMHSAQAKKVCDYNLFEYLTNYKSN